MKHATSRMLFAYWDALRGERAAPERRELAPAAMRHVLADTFILDAAALPSPTFRLAGSRCAALFGRELRTTPFGDLWPPAARTAAEDLVDLVAAETVGAVAGLVGTNENGSRLPLELILLPLRHRGRTRARVLGSLSPITLPAWAGLVPVRGLETVSVRTLTASRSDPEPRDEGLGGRRHRFVVHEGGRATEARAPA